MNMLDSSVSKFPIRKLDDIDYVDVKVLDEEELTDIAGGHNAGQGSLWL